MEVTIDTPGMPPQVVSLVQVPPQPGDLRPTWISRARAETEVESRGVAGGSSSDSTFQFQSSGSAYASATTSLPDGDMTMSGVEPPGGPAPPGRYGVMFFPGWLDWKETLWDTFASLEEAQHMCKICNMTLRTFQAPFKGTSIVEAKSPTTQLAWIDGSCPLGPATTAPAKPPKNPTQAAAQVLRACTATSSALQTEADEAAARLQAKFFGTRTSSAATNVTGDALEQSPGATAPQAPAEDTEAESDLLDETA